MSATTTTKLSFKHKGKDCTAGCRSKSQSKSQSQVRPMRLREDGRRGPAAGNGYRARRHSEGPVGHRHHRYHHRPRADCKPRKYFWERQKERTRGARVSTTTRRFRYNATNSHPMMKDAYLPGKSKTTTSLPVVLTSSTNKNHRCFLIALEPRCVSI